jgi:hypothetical protein
MAIDLLPHDHINSIPNRVQGAIFDLAGSFGINIRGDPACVPLSLEGLSKATTSQNMQYVNGMCMHID